MRNHKIKISGNTIQRKYKIRIPDEKTCRSKSCQVVTSKNHKDLILELTLIYNNAILIIYYNIIAQKYRILIILLNDEIMFT